MVFTVPLNNVNKTTPASAATKRASVPADDSSESPSSSSEEEEEAEKSDEDEDDESDESDGESVENLAEETQREAAALKAGVTEKNKRKWNALYKCEFKPLNHPRSCIPGPRIFNPSISAMSVFNPKADPADATVPWFS